MSSDGEINVAVKAEGVDDAVEDAGEGGASVGGTGGGGGLSDALKGGIVGGLVGTLLGPLLDALSPITKILEAFLAPLAAMLLRLLSPVLRHLVQLLPAWFDFVDGLTIDELVDWVKDLPSMIWDFISRLPGKIGNALSDLPSAIWSFVQQLGGIFWDLAVQTVSWFGKSMKEIAEIIADAIKRAFTPASVEGENFELSPETETGLIDPRKVPGLRQAFEAGQRAGQISGDPNLGTVFEVQTDETDWVVVQERNNSLETGG